MYELCLGRGENKCGRTQDGRTDNIPYPLCGGDNLKKKKKK